MTAIKIKHNIYLIRIILSQIKLSPSFFVSYFVFTAKTRGPISMVSVRKLLCY